MANVRPMRNCGLRHTGPCPAEDVPRDGPGYTVDDSPETVARNREDAGMTDPFGASDDPSDTEGDA